MKMSTTKVDIFFALYFFPKKTGLLKPVLNRAIM